MGSTECIDRISDLSDDILCKILSYLSLEDVFATSVLSTRWKPLFPSSVALVRLDLGDSCKLEIVHKFMNKLLNVTLRDVRCVEKIVFDIKDLCWYLDDAFVLWIGRAFKRLNVQHLQLMLDQCESMAVFESMHGCSTLVELELGSFSNLDLSNEFILPNLKRLSLYEFRLYRDNPIDDKDLKKLLDGCPVLNDLRIINCLFGNLDTFHIQHPKIKKLYLDEGSSDRRVVIDCPDLEVIMFKDRCCVKEDFDLKNTKTLRLACFDFFCYDDGNTCELAKLVKACSSTTHLCLSGTLMTSLFHWSVPLPTFQNLTCLALGHLGLNGWVMLVRLLESAPNLTVLSFEEELGFKWPYMDSTSLVQSSTKSKSLLPCSSRAYTNINSSLPVNLLLNTKKIEIWEFKWKPEEMKLIEYFLKEGKVLQELIVHCFPCENISDLQKVLLLPRYSRACQVLFKDKSNFESNFEKSRYSRKNWF